jgi:predicted Zn-dependent protease
MITEWRGIYLDGKTAKRNPVSVKFKADGLEISNGKDVSVVWLFHDLRQTQGNYQGEQCRLERNPPASDILIISNPLFLKELHPFSPQIVLQNFEFDKGKSRKKVLLSAVVGVIFLGIVIYMWIVPLASTFLVRAIPVSWEENYGNSIMKQFGAPEDFCNDPRKIKSLKAILKKLTDAIPNNPYTFQLKVVRSDYINAFAVPGGFIVVFSSLLEKTETSEEFAGVLAHEIEHIVQRHSTRELLRQISLGLLISAVTGNSRINVPYSLEGFRILETLSYNRKIETEADEEGMKLLLKAGFQPEGMIHFFEKMAREEREFPTFLNYLLTHPATSERIEKLKSLATQLPNQTSGQINNDEWKENRMICRDSI